MELDIGLEACQFANRGINGGPGTQIGAQNTQFARLPLGSSPQGQQLGAQGSHLKSDIDQANNFLLKFAEQKHI
jgi:hypothetical protein